MYVVNCKKKKKVKNDCYDNADFCSRCFHLFGVLRPTRDFFNHFETGPLLVKVCNVLPTLVTYGHGAVRVLKRATPNVTLAIRLLSVYYDRLQETMTLTPVAERFAVKLSLPV